MRPLPWSIKHKVSLGLRLKIVLLGRFSSHALFRVLRLTHTYKKAALSDGFFGRRVEARTPDPLIKSQLLYQLSYAPITKTVILDSFFKCKYFYYNYSRSRQNICNRANSFVLSDLDTIR